MFPLQGLHSELRRALTLVEGEVVVPRREEAGEGFQNQAVVAEGLLPEKLPRLVDLEENPPLMAVVRQIERAKADADRAHHSLDLGEKLVRDREIGQLAEVGQVATPIQRGLRVGLRVNPGGTVVVAEDRQAQFELLFDTLLVDGRGELDRLSGQGGRVRDEGGEGRVRFLFLQPIDCPDGFDADGAVLSQKGVNGVGVVCDNGLRDAKAGLGGSPELGEFIPTMQDPCRRVHREPGFAQKRHASRKCDRATLQVWSVRSEGFWLLDQMQRSTSVPEGRNLIDRHDDVLIADRDRSIGAVLVEADATVGQDRIEHHDLVGRSDEVESGRDEHRMHVAGVGEGQDSVRQGSFLNVGARVHLAGPSLSRRQRPSMYG